MSTTLLETLTLAEEILLHLLESHPTAKHHRKTFTAIAAIREQKAELEKQEPVAIIKECIRIARMHNNSGEGGVIASEIEKLYAAPVSIAKQSETDSSSSSMRTTVRTKDLTDDEIDAFIDRAWDKQMSMPEIIRAVIAADREKNK